MSNFISSRGVQTFERLVKRQAFRKGARDLFQGLGFRSDYEFWEEAYQYNYERGRRFATMLHTAGVAWDGVSRFPYHAHVWVCKNADDVIGELNV